MKKATKAVKKKIKNTKWSMVYNEVVPQPDMEILPVDTMDGKEAATQLYNRRYIDIEKCLDPAVFYGLTGLLKGDVYRNKSKRFSISQFHGASIEVLMESGFIEAKKADIVRGIVTTGLLSLRIKGGSGEAGTKNTLKKVGDLSARILSNTNYLDGLLSVLKVGDHKASRAFCRKIVSKFGNNRYGSQVLHHITSKTGRPEKPPVYRRAANPLSEAGVTRCEAMSHEPLNEKMYVIDENKEEKAYTTDVYMSERFWLLLDDYKRAYLPGGTKTQVLRACTVTGLYCLSKWLLKSKICKDEANFSAICRAIDKYGIDHF